MLQAEKQIKDIKCSKCRIKILKGETVLVESGPGGVKKSFCRNHGTEKLIEARQYLFKVETDIYGSGGA